MQIFNDLSAEDITSSSEDSTSGFAAKARTERLRSGCKRKRCPCPRRDHLDFSSTSVADTESWPTEQVDEEEAVLTEADDSSRDGAAQRKGPAAAGRVRRIVAALAKIPRLGRKSVTSSGVIYFTFDPNFAAFTRSGPRTASLFSVRLSLSLSLPPFHKTDRGDGDTEWRRQARITSVGKPAGIPADDRPTSPVRGTYRACTTKKVSSATLSSSDEEDEQRALLRARDRQVDRLEISDWDDFRDDIYSTSYDSHRQRRGGGTVCRRRPDPRASIDRAAELRDPRNGKKRRRSPR